MSAERRVLYSWTIERAEAERQLGRVSSAAELAATGLGLREALLTEEEVVEFARSPQDRAVLACLARIHVDSLKTVANRARFPHQALDPLEQATRTISTVYRSPVFQSAIEGVTCDHLKRQHYRQTLRF